MAKDKSGPWRKPAGLNLLRGWARDGLTDEQIAKNIGISRSTFYDWKKRYPDISDTVETNKEAADYQVENALYNLAVGFTDAVGKYHPPNIKAIIFWLKNRNPKSWRDQLTAADLDEEMQKGPTPMQQLVTSLQNAVRERKKGEEK